MIKQKNRTNGAKAGKIAREKSGMLPAKFKAELIAALKKKRMTRTEIEEKVGNTTRFGHIIKELKESGVIRVCATLARGVHVYELTGVEPIDESVPVGFSNFIFEFTGIGCQRTKFF